MLTLLHFQHFDILIMKIIRKLAALDKIEPNVIVGKSNKRSKIVDKDGMYTYKMKIKRKNSIRLIIPLPPRLLEKKMGPFFGAWPPAQEWRAAQASQDA